MKNGVTPGLYQHFKGAYYKVVGVARHSETEEELVSYQALYGDKGLWVRPLSMFVESITRDGETFPRFARCAEQTMVLEIAKLTIIKGEEANFEASFARASEIIAARQGYISHRLIRSKTIQNEFLLTVEWQTVEDHKTGFRQSAEYQRWSELLHHFYDPFPTVEYYKF